MATMRKHVHGLSTKVAVKAVRSAVWRSHVFWALASHGGDTSMNVPDEFC